jgi:rubrerythrin
MEENIDDILAVNETELSVVEEITPENDELEILEEEAWGKEELVEAILVCEECNNQWEDMVSDSDRDNLFCPMCGTSRVVQV